MAAQTPAEAVQVDKVRLVYGAGATAVLALDAVDLAVRRGEMLALMGPSGSGKTTLLMVMGCLLRPTAGSVRILGQEIAGLSQAAMARLRLAHVGFVFQAYNLFPALTAVETIRLALELKGWPGDRARAEAPRLLAQVGLTDKADCVPGQLSGGQKQRVAIARALAGSPELILGDEPTAALDWGTGRGIIELMRQLTRDEACAVVVVTHDPRVAELADRVVMLEDGRASGERKANP
jgi:putative ABC transport system ATP-binding protein